MTKTPAAFSFCLALCASAAYADNESTPVYRTLSFECSNAVSKVRLAELLLYPGKTHIFCGRLIKEDLIV
jgi:hypothetical protein